MSALHGALRIHAASPGQDLGKAAILLSGATGIVLLEDSIALRPAGGYLACEVIDPSPGARRCAAEYEVLIENAQRALQSSPLAARLPALERRWSVVELRDGRVVRSWPDPPDAAP